MNVLIMDSNNEVYTEILTRLQEKGAKGWQFTQATDVQDGLRICREGCDFLFLSNDLPAGSPTELLPEFLAAAPELPVIIYGHQVSLAEKIAAFKLGADDYVAAPFDVLELLARAQVVMRRINRSCPLTFGDLSLDRQTFELVCGEERVYLSIKEFQVLELLLENGGRPVKREQFLERIWGDVQQAEYNSVEVYISFVRKKLAQLDSGAWIKTHRGYGYSLLAA